MGLSALDKRYAITRLLHQQYTQLCQDLGGIESMSLQQRSLAERAVFLEQTLRTMEEAHAAGGAFELGSYIAGVNALSSLFQRLGLKRIAKPTQQLHEYMAAQLPEAKDTQ